jgi:hypothetical protein
MTFSLLIAAALATSLPCISLWVADLNRRPSR